MAAMPITRTVVGTVMATVFQNDEVKPVASRSA